MTSRSRSQRRTRTRTPRRMGQVSRRESAGCAGVLEGRGQHPGRGEPGEPQHTGAGASPHWSPQPQGPPPHPFPYGHVRARHEGRSERWGGWRQGGSQGPWTGRGPGRPGGKAGSAQPGCLGLGAGRGPEVGMCVGGLQRPSPSDSCPGQSYHPHRRVTGMIVAAQLHSFLLAV